MEQQEYDDLVRRLVAVSERQDDRQADMQSLLTSLNTKYQRMDVSLTFIDEAMGKQTTILEEVKNDLHSHTALLTELKALAGHSATLLDRITLVLERHEATFERLGRLLDERLPPPGNGR